MNNLDGLVKMLTNATGAIVQSGAAFLSKYGFFIAIALIISMTAKVFDFKVKVGK